MKPEKVKKSLRYDEVYGDLIGGKDNFIKDYLICLEQKAQDFDSVNTDWVFFKEFAGRNTEDLHKKFVTHYPKLQRKKDVGDFDGKCSVCGKDGKIRYPDLPFFAVGISNYAHNLKADHSAFRIRICSDCEPYIAAGWKYLNDLFRGKFYALVPKLRDETTTKDSLENFVKLVNNNLSNFEKLNNVLGDGHIKEEIELSFIVMRKEQKTVIEKFVPNYKTFAIRFEYESLIQDDELEYVDKDWKSKKVVVRNINSFFELERLLKFFFVYNNNQRLSEFFHFYQLYNKGIPENKKMQMDSNFKHLMYIYRDNLFSFIYETNLSALNESMLNDICLNFLLYEIRKQREFWGDKAETNIAFKIMESLNYYYFIKHKIRGDVKMKEQILSLKSEFEKLENDEAKEEAEKRIEEIVEEDDRLVYYLIGQFIKKIDDSRGDKNKIFDGFVQSINRKSIKQRFAEDILQKQNYYVEQLNHKAKFIFDIMANNLDKLFEYEPYEEMVISLITGYYSNEIY